MALPDSEVATFPQKYKAQRAASVILTEYVEQKDSSFYLTISREDAKEAIKEMNKKGQKIDLPDLEEIKKAARGKRGATK